MPDNDVNVDNDALAAEAAGIPLPPDATPAGGAAPGPETAPAAIDQAPQPSSWASSTPMLVFLIDRLAVPNWKLTDQEKGDLGDALAPVLDDLFPGGMGSEKWAPYFRLLAVGASITLARVHDGKLTPLRAPSDDEAAPAADPDAEAKTAGPFMTGGAPGAGSH